MTWHGMLACTTLLHCDVCTDLSLCVWEVGGGWHTSGCYDHDQHQHQDCTRTMSGTSPRVCSCACAHVCAGAQGGRSVQHPDRGCHTAERAQAAEGRGGGGRCAQGSAGAPAPAAEYCCRHRRQAVGPHVRQPTRQAGGFRHNPRGCANTAGVSVSAQQGLQGRSQGGGCRARAWLVSVHEQPRCAPCCHLGRLCRVHTPACRSAQGQSACVSLSCGIFTHHPSPTSLCHNTGAFTRAHTQAPATAKSCRQVRQAGGTKVDRNSRQAAQQGDGASFRH